MWSEAARRDEEYQEERREAEGAAGDPLSNTS